MIPSRYELRRWLWLNSTLPRSRGCLRFGSRVRVVLGAGGSGGATVRGATRCGSVWCCPTCSTAVASRRVPLIARAADLLDDPVMVTLTAPHEAGGELRQALTRMQAYWRAVRTGRGAGAMPYVRVLEVTTGARGGWHVHYHVLTDARYAAGLVNRWLDRVPGAVREAQDVTEADPSGVSEYLAGELMGSQYKGRSQWSLLAAASRGDDRARWAWEEFEQSISGCRQVTWSRDLARQVGEEVDLTDQDLCDDEMIERADDVVVVSFTDGDTWRTFLGASARLGHLIAAINARDMIGAVRWLHSALGDDGYTLSLWGRTLLREQEAAEAARRRELSLW